MTTYASSRGASLDRAYRHWRERGALLDLPVAKETTQPMTIAISRECGAGGAEIARALADKLGWPVYDRELVDKIAEDTGIHSQLLGHLDEKRPHWLAECMKGFSPEKHISGVGFAIRLKKILLALYCHGECIVLGRGAAQLLPSDRTLLVRLVAPETCRMARISKQLGITEKAAKHRIAEIDAGRVEFVQSYFHQNPTEPCNYDVVINTLRLHDEACVEVIFSALAGRRGEN